MDFNVILNRLNELTTFKNNVIANSKKILSLPPSTSGDKLVAVWNVLTETTEQYNFSELIAYVNSINTRIVNYGTIDRDENEFTFNIGFEWIIQGIEYANASAVVHDIELAESGNNRIDIAVLNAFNGIDIITGFETDGTAEQPLPPPNTILLKIFVVTDTDVDVEDPPVSYLIVAEVDGAIISGVNRINFDGATVTDNGSGIVTVTISGGGSTPTLGEVLAVGDRESNSALDGDTLIDLEAHTKVVTCESLSGNTTFIVPTISDFNTAFPLISVSAPEFKILNNSAFTITLQGDTGVNLIGSVLEIPQNAVACVKYLENIFDAYSVTYQLNTVSGGGGVQSVTGDGVDNTDPDNPVLSFPDATPSTKGKAKLYNSLGTNTDGAVDQNTVKTALDLKANNATTAKVILMDSTPLGSNVTGGNLTLIKSWLIPANTFVEGAKYDIEGIMRAITLNSAKSVGHYINTSNSMSGATQIGRTANMNAGADYLPIKRQYILRSGSLVGISTGFTGTSDEGLSLLANNVFESFTFDRTIDNYIIFALVTGNASDTFNLHSFEINETLQKTTI